MYMYFNAAACFGPLKVYNLAKIRLCIRRRKVHKLETQHYNCVFNAYGLSHSKGHMNNNYIPACQIWRSCG
jgi:hypothetical protein